MMLAILRLLTTFAVQVAAPAGSRKPVSSASAQYCLRHAPRAEAYREQTVAEAKGQASRFSQVAE
jgi:hypothetical protein